MNEQEILENMVKIADELNFGLDTNSIKIAKLKSRMDDWKRCPCDKDNTERFCGSKLCQDDTIRDGYCHCHSFFKLNNNILNSKERKIKRGQRKKRKKNW